MDVCPYLTFNGNCEEALQFYAEVLGAEVVTMSKFGGSPMEEHTDEEHHDKVMHASIKLGDSTIMASDNIWPGYSPPSGISVTLGIDGIEQARKVFNALSEGGKVTMEFEKTFWAVGFGMVTDRFGIPWLVNCEQ